MMIIIPLMMQTLYLPNHEKRAIKIMVWISGEGENI